MEDNKKRIITKLNGTAIAGMVMVVIVAAIAGITVCVKHVINPDLFE